VLRDTQVRSIYDAYKEKQFDPSRAADAQIVVTAPGYHGDASDGQTPNNAYNDAFAAALANDPRFKPYVLDAGVRHLARVAVFVRQ
jgi:DnaJ-class molecular chaperone